ncbi:2-dehydro-3-deoxy-D-gluconate 5-dehydrogenase KduD [Paenibacillus mucilaginosus]|nr:2-dehydro-3-deoxy-D-gluconate 5-dehydrogenase KduD [Paenibacillus mucilaginosus]AEI39183.1 2-deoxy-D-gluconate 3-dehydrogenase [Paenibacillus mucilaginosus KNP414]AFH59617.1 2-deoxy-D-gluconate 3-dehydrogenase [Paenibacillus mucilaginosus K02]MCG7217983.1 2-dehydro-3-deoxy-D-gluconate 5-dehydrogenase KduD [Paenibacillus mucilaginosus]WDM28197.1 2-dehydro-3-deoxy-D-gluconate 5-dehydrogenase KduD [Paenibacillus mucilaginosus]WFA16375.1 2-dehydro-3-deoxy-D-gluconate 5-dehydrogenase KduD [Paeni
MNLFDLTGKVALVTGGAVGLGGGISLGLAKAGADIVIVTSNDRSREVQQEIEAMGRKVHTIVANLMDEQALKGVVEEALSVFGKIDILVNNSGIIRRTPAAEHGAQDWHDVLNLNLNSAFFLCQLVGREMIKQGSGKIINIASLLSFQGGINVPGYTASKHAIAGVTKALANEWASKGVQVNAIAPGYMSTDNTAALRADEERSSQILVRIPAARWGTTEDLQGPVIFLASAASDYMNGHVLAVDGGWMAR